MIRGIGYKKSIIIRTRPVIEQWEALIQPYVKPSHYIAKFQETTLANIVCGERYVYIVYHMIKNLISVIY